MLREKVEGEMALLSKDSSVKKSSEDKQPSGTLALYIRIKRILVDDGYLWEDKNLFLSTLMKACKIINNKVKT